MVGFFQSPLLENLLGAVFAQNRPVASSLLEARGTAGTYPIMEQELLGLWLLLLGLVGCGDFGVKGRCVAFRTEWLAPPPLKHRKARHCRLCSCYGERTLRASFIWN